MSDLKNCPTCNSQGIYAGTAMHTEFYKCSNIDCVMSERKIPYKSWQSRPIEDKYRKALEDIRTEFFKKSLHDGATASNMLKIANEALK